MNKTASAPVRQAFIRQNGVGVAASIAMAALFFFVLKDRYINHDTAWYLVATRQWLDGAQLYVDLIEVNPPLNFYLTIPAIWIADNFGLTDTDAQYLFLCSLIAVSLIWVWTLLNQADWLTRNQRLTMLVASALALMVPAISYVGQREHLMLVFVLPYVMGYLLLGVPDKGRGAIARAIFAAIGICIKPHFILIPLAITLVQTARTRRLGTIFSQANLAMLAVGVAYVGAAKWLHPQYFDSIVPMALLVYGDYGYENAIVVRHMKPVLGVLFLLTMLAAARAGQTPRAGFLVAIFLAGVGIYVAQWTGFNYQAIPMHSFAFLGFGWVLIYAGRQAKLASALAVVGVLFSCVSAVQSGFYRNDATEIFGPVIQAAVETPKIMVFSPSLSPSFPMVLELKAEWTSRYPALWLLPGSENGLARADCTATSILCGDLRAIQDQTRRDMVQDLVRRAPNILIFDTQPLYFDDPFDYHAFLKADPRYDAALAQFRIVRSGARFVIWARK